MDYKTNVGEITTEVKSRDVANLLAYDVAFAKLKRERKEKKKHA